MAKRLKVGIIGLGSISPFHIDSYKACPRAEIVAVCDKSESWLEFVKNKHGIPKAYTDYKELLKDSEIEAVSLCLPTYMHAEGTIAALEAGKHVLCEKPMAANARDAKKMHEAAVKSGKKLMISQNMRFDQITQTLHERAESGFFGDIYFARIAWRRPLGMMPGPEDIRENGEKINRNWFNEKDFCGGVLRDLGSHLIDLTMFITGFPKLASADARAYRKFFPEEYKAGNFICDSEDMATAHIKFENGLTVQLEVSFGSFIEEQIILTEIYGTKGGAARRGGSLKFFAQDGAGNGITEHLTRFKAAHKGPQARFVDCVLDDTEVPVPSEQGVKVIEILDAIYASAGKIL